MLYCSEGPWEARSPRNLEKPASWPKAEYRGKRRAIVDLAAPVLHPEAPDLTSAHIGEAATGGSAGTGWIAGRRLQVGVCSRQGGSRLAGGATGRAAPLRRGWREGRQAGGPAGKARRLPKPSRHAGGADGRDTGRAQPQASRPHGRQREHQRARHRWRPAGLHAGHTMRGACGPHNAGRMRATQCGAHANVQTDR